MMNITTFKKIFPVLRLVDAPSGLGKTDRTLDIGKIDAGDCGDHIKMVAEDMSTVVTARAFDVAAENFSTCINLSKFDKLVGSIKTLPHFMVEGDGDLRLDLAKRVIKLPNQRLCRRDYGKREYSAKEGAEIQWASDALWEGLNYAAKTMSSDETRFHLNGMHFAKNGDLVATDGHRLHVYDYCRMNDKAPEFFGFKHDTIVPAKAIKMVLAAMKACGGAKSMVYTSRNDLRMNFVIDGGGLSFTITTKLIESTYPPYQNVIPSSTKTKSTCVVESLAFLEAAKLLVKMSDDRSKTVEYSLNGALHLKGGGVSESLPTTLNEGEKFEFGSYGANGTYLADSADLPNGEITLEFGDVLDPVKITSGCFLSVVMPLRV